jgi:hypothetical protein
VCVCACCGGAEKYDSELAAEEAAIKETKSKEQEAKKAQGGWRNLAEVSQSL